jgi:radical SAM superfamily enzyme YgiQ (UPF0313 family)
MKILYVNPGRIEAGLDAIIKSPPLALMSIAAMVPEHEAKIFDFKVDHYRESSFRKLLRTHDIVAITSMTPQISSALDVAEMAKKEGAITILGGYHPTLEPDFCAAHPAIDFVVRGEGEHTFKEVVDFIAKSPNAKLKKDILSISYKDENGIVIHNAQRPLETNLDVFPIPRRDLIKGKSYSYLGTRVMLMETSRGCPHKCAFCCIIKMWSDPTGLMSYRTKSIKRIMQELYTIDTNWDFVFFNDDNFTINIKRTDKILDAIKKSGLNRRFFFSCQSRVDTFHRNPWLAPKMAEVGFKQVFFGIESVHQASLDAMGKKTNPDMIRAACKMATDNGISIFGGMIVGFPGETKEMVRENINFAISLNLDFVQFTPITAFPGTPFFKEMEAAGRIATYDWKYYNLFHPMMRTEQLTRNELFELVAEAYGKYYITRKYIQMMGKRAFSHPKFKWYRKIAPRWFKQVVFGGLGMFKSMGMTGVPRDNTEMAKKQEDRYYRWKKFQMLMKQVQQNGIELKSPNLLAYVK